LIGANIGAISSVDCPLDDRIHLSLEGQYTVGKRLAIAAQAALNNQAFTASPQINQGSIIFEHLQVSKHTSTYALKLSFKNLVNFTDVDNSQGFSLRDADGVDLDLIYRTEFYQENQIIRLLLTDVITNTNTTYLCYSYGKNPICNIASTNGMGLLAFGPIPFTFN
jgi:hypothetical protein